MYVYPRKGQFAVPPSIQDTTNPFSPGVTRPEREVTTHLYLAPNLRIRGGIPPFAIRLHAVVLKE
jgi:hypothetical protein